MNMRIVLSDLKADCMHVCGGLGPRMLAMRGLFALFLLFFADQALAQTLDTLRGKIDYEGHRIPYTVLLKAPHDEPGVQVPVFIFLHGAGERGSDNQAQLTVGLPALVKSLEALQMPCYAIYAPQCPVDQKWVDTDWTASSHVMAAKMNGPLEAAFAAFDSLIAVTAGVDHNRLYLTGLSMGGFGVWDLLQRYPTTFAAAMPICGGGDTAQVTQLTKMPVWAFHGRKDKLVKVARTLDMIAALKVAGGQPLMTILEDQGHLCWNKVYQNLDAVAWLISQHRNDQ